MRTKFSVAIILFGWALLLLILAVMPFFLPSKAADAAAAGGCDLFPKDNVWNTRIDRLPLDPNSIAYVSSIGLDTGLKADFGSGLWNGGPIGIPYTTVPGTQPKVPVRFDYADESDPGPYPIPADAPIEGGSQSNGDRHVLVVERDNCLLYETWATYPEGSGWSAGSGAIFDLRSNVLRPETWTSSDSAGLPVLPGLVRYDEVASGSIDHAIRFTAANTQRAYVWPARHYASTKTSPNLPPMGQRFRLKASVDVSGYPTNLQVILNALKTYGLILADNGSNWFLSGSPDERWNNDQLQLLRQVKGLNFEAVDASGLMVDVNSARAKTCLASLGSFLTPNPGGRTVYQTFSGVSVYVPVSIGQAGACQSP